MNRRMFLTKSGQIAAGVGVAPLLPRLFASSAFAQSTNEYKAIVCLLLDGGNDGNNMLVPADKYYAEYAAGRGGLALDRATLNVMSAASSGRTFGTHQALKQVSTLFNSGHAAFLANAGPLTSPVTKQTIAQGSPTPLDLFSHTSQSSEWQSALTASVSTSGWGGRIADVMSAQSSGTSAPMVISTAGWSLMGSGAKTTAGCIGSGANTVGVLNALQALAPALQQMESGDPLNHLHDQISTIQQSQFSTTNQLNQAFQAGSTLKTAFPPTSLGQQLQSIAQMISGRSALDVSRQIFFCKDPDYDMHANQLSLQSQNLSGLDAAIGAFVAAMTEIGMFDQVTLFTMSDFARAHAPNSTGGTDHAWGNHHLIVGGAVKGGDVYGTFPSLALGGDDDAGSTGLWIPTTSGSQYAATLARWLGVNSSDSASIFPELGNFSKPTLGFL